MPVYNGGDFLEEAISALLSQTFGDFSLLISDNASTDGSWELLERKSRADSRIVLHRQPENVGVLENFRYVLERADSEFFMWHASDDWLAPDYLEVLLREIGSDTRCGLACATAQRTDVRGRFVRESPAPVLTGISSSLGRTRKMLRRSSAPWIYGIFRTKDLRAAHSVAVSFGHAWGGDRIVLLPFILSDSIRGTGETRIYKRRSSDGAYRPATLAKSMRYLGRYVWYHLRVLSRCEHPVRDRLRLAPWVLWHAMVTANLGYIPRAKRFARSVEKALSLRSGGG